MRSTKLSRDLLFAWALTACGSLGFAADAAFEKERQQLRAQRDAAVKTATEPIDRGYQASLEQLLRKAMQGNDLDAAVKIRRDLAALKVGKPEQELEKDLAGKWRVRNTRNGWSDEWTIRADGTIVATGETQRWNVEGAKLMVTHGKGASTEWDLPVQSGRLKGRDGKGNALTADKQ
jgi:hypothetical protein